MFDKINLYTYRIDFVYANSLSIKTPKTLDDDVIEEIMFCSQSKNV